MSIDQRLRDLRGDPEPGPDVLLLDQIAERAHGRQRRSRAVAIAAAAVVLAVVAAAPVVWSRLDNDSQPVHPPTPSPPGVTQSPAPSIATTFSGDGQQVRSPSLVEAPGWETRIAAEELWLRPFVGTPIESQARQVYRKAKFEGYPMSMELQHTFATIRIGHNGNVAAAPVLTLSGTYRVHGHLLELQLDGVGTSRFRWDVQTSGPGDNARELTLTYLDSSGPPQFGAPSGVLLRLLLTSQPYLYHQGP